MLMTGKRPVTPPACLAHLPSLLPPPPFPPPPIPPPPIPSSSSPVVAAPAFSRSRSRRAEDAKRWRLHRM